MIIDHNHPNYRKIWVQAGRNKYNGAFYYSKEIVKNIIPRVETDRSWITVNIPGTGCDHAILFVHNNLNPEHYEWLKTYGYTDVVLVCGIPETVEKVAHLGKAVYLPLSIDVDYVKQFKVPKSEHSGTAFVGRPAKRLMQGVKLPTGIDILENMKRQDMLPQMAQYEYVYAVGRTAIEAKVLGCKLKAYDPRFPDARRWKIYDNKQAAKELSKILNEIDGKRMAGRPV